MGGEPLFIGFIVGVLVYTFVMPVMKMKIRMKEETGGDAGGLKSAYKAIDWIGDVFTLQGERSGNNDDE